MPQYPPDPKAVSAGDKPYCDFLWRKLLPYPVPKPPEDLQLGYSKLAQKGFEHRCVRWDSRAPSFEHLVLGKNIAHDMKSGADGAHFFGVLLLTFSFDKHILIDLFSLIFGHTSDTYVDF